MNGYYGLNLLVLLFLCARWLMEAPETLDQPAAYVIGSIGGSALMGLPFLFGLMGFSAPAKRVARIAKAVTYVYLFFLVCGIVALWMRASYDPSAAKLVPGLTLAAAFFGGLLWANLSGLTTARRRLQGETRTGSE